MGIASFLMKEATQIDTLDLDVSVSETHGGQVEVTTHPVELGADVTDHARPKPRELTIEGLISDTPITRDPQLRTVQAYGQLFKTTANESASQQVGFAAQAAAKLIELRESPRLIVIKTGLLTYTNMMMVSLVMPRDNKTGQALRFTCQFREIRLVASKLTAAKTKQANGGKKVSTGKQVPKTTDKSTKGKSIAEGLAEKLNLYQFLGVAHP